MILSPKVAWEVKFYGHGQCIIPKLSEYNIFLFLYKALYLYIRLQLALI